MAATPPLTRPPSPENEINPSTLLFEHTVPSYLFKKPGSGKPDDPSRPPLMEVKSDVIQVFINLQSKTRDLIGKFQEKINQSDLNILKPFTKEPLLPPSTLSSTASKQVSQHDNNHNDASTVLQSVSQATSPDSVEQVVIVDPANIDSSSKILQSPSVSERASNSQIDSSNNISSDLQFANPVTIPDLIKQVTEVDSTESSKILQSPSVPERASSSPTREAFVSPSRSPLPEHLANQIESHLSTSPLQNSLQDLSPQLSHSPNLIVGAEVKMVGKVDEEKAGRVDDPQSISCFAEISPVKTFSPQKLSTNLGDPPQSPKPLGTSHNQLPPQKQPPPPSNKNNSTSCFDEALKFFVDLIDKCCEPTKVPAKPVAKSKNSRTIP